MRITVEANSAPLAGLGSQSSNTQMAEAGKFQLFFSMLEGIPDAHATLSAPEQTQISGDAEADPASITTPEADDFGTDFVDEDPQELPPAPSPELGPPYSLQSVPALLADTKIAQELGKKSINHTENIAKSLPFDQQETPTVPIQTSEETALGDKAPAPDPADQPVNDATMVERPAATATDPEQVFLISPLSAETLSPRVPDTAAQVTQSANQPFQSGMLLHNERSAYPKVLDREGSADPIHQEASKPEVDKQFYLKELDASHQALPSAQHIDDPARKLETQIVHEDIALFSSKSRTISALSLSDTPEASGYSKISSNSKASIHINTASLNSKSEIEVKNIRQLEIEYGESPASTKSNVEYNATETPPPFAESNQLTTSGDKIEKKIYAALYSNLNMITDNSPNAPRHSQPGAFEHVSPPQITQKFENNVDQLTANAEIIQNNNAAIETTGHRPTKITEFRLDAGWSIQISKQGSYGSDQILRPESHQENIKVSLDDFASGTIEVSFADDEFGPVRLQIDSPKEGSLIVSSDSKEAILVLKNHSNSLLREMSEMGIPPTRISFSERQLGADRRQDNRGHQSRAKGFDLDSKRPSGLTASGIREILTISGNDSLNIII